MTNLGEISVPDIYPELELQSTNLAWTCVLNRNIEFRFQIPRHCLLSIYLFTLM